MERIAYVPGIGLFLVDLNDKVTTVIETTENVSDCVHLIGTNVVSDYDGVITCEIKGLFRNLLNHLEDDGEMSHKMYYKLLTENHDGM